MPINKQILSKYLNPVFIETGSHVGNGIQAALDAGFKTIYSIELSKEFYEKCLKRFEENKDITIINGDSGEVMNELLNKGLSDNINNVTFFLDSHWSGGTTAKGEINCPLINELKAIKKFYKKGDIILIDDVRLMTNKKDEYDFEVTPGIVEAKLKEIDKYFIIEYIDSAMFKNDILVARS